MRLIAGYNRIMSIGTKTAMIPLIEAYEKFARDNIRETWLHEEEDLFASKWFDYRFLHPTAATLLYVDAYEKAWRHACRANFDARKARFAPVANSATYLSESALTKSTLWPGRMTADRFGLPYDQFLSIAFDERLRCWRQSYMPAPNLLYSDSLLPFIFKRWQERLADQIWYSREEVYLVKNFTGSPHQLSHMEWIKYQASASRYCEYTLTDLHKKGNLTDAYLPA